MSISNEYHNATKYAPESIGDIPPADWDAQPTPYKDFHSKSRIELGEFLLLTQEEDSDEPILKEADPTSPHYHLSRLSTLLLHINGVTAQQRTNGDPIFYRSAPSAGALYPTEIYLAIRDTPGVEDGIYNYQVRDHTLAPVLEGNFWPDLGACIEGDSTIENANIVFLLSIVFLRSSWRYHDRSYRRILLDSGHVLGNLMVFSPEMSYCPKAITAFHDQGLNDFMFFDGAKESTLILVALEEEPHPRQPLGVSQGSGQSVEENLILRTHQASQITSLPIETSSPKPVELLAGKKSQLTFALSRKQIPWEGSLGPTILLRRSTRSFSGAPMSMESLGMILGYGYLGTQTSDKNHFLDPARIDTFLAVHRVEDLEQGLYQYDPCSSRLLLQRRGYFARENHEIGLGQELMRDACVIIYHFANIEDTTAALGERGYRYLNLDCGHIGQRLNLAALKLNLGVSGIGGYFDDQVNELFHRPASESVLYATCIGQPLG